MYKLVDQPDSAPEGVQLIRPTTPDSASTATAGQSALMQNATVFAAPESTQDFLFGENSTILALLQPHPPLS